MVQSSSSSNLEDSSEAHMNPKIPFKMIVAKRVTLLSTYEAVQEFLLTSKSRYEIKQFR